MVWITIIGAVALYIIGFVLGRKYERDAILENVYGVMSEINKSDLSINSVTYYYTQAAYEERVKQLNEEGKEYEEEEE